MAGGAPHTHWIHASIVNRDASAPNGRDGLRRRMAPKVARQPPSPKRAHALARGTRIPNLLIRRSPSAVHRRPQLSTHAGTKGFRFHRRPQPSTPVHSEWLPTWLPRLTAIWEVGMEGKQCVRPSTSFWPLTGQWPIRSIRLVSGKRKRPDRAMPSTMPTVTVKTTAHPTVRPRAR